MKLYSLLILLVVLISLISAKPSRDRNNKPYRVVCYWGTWAFYRPETGKFEAENINPNLCTHLNYGFAKLSGNSIALFDPDLDDGDEDWHSGQKWGHGMIRRMINLRNYNPNLSTLISIGGWTEGSDKYSQMARSPENRRQFVQSVLEFLKKYDLDGLDIDWEFPTMQAAGDGDRKPGRLEDRQDFVQLLKELHEAFEPYGYILSAAVSAGKPTIDRAYDIPGLSKYLDYINLMSYDYHGGWEDHTGHNAPLYPLPNSNELDQEFTVSYSVKYWLEHGVDPKKLILGLPVYGRTFTLAGQEHGLNAPTIGHGGQSGKITRQEGILGYNEICPMIKQGGWDLYRDPIEKIPYAVHANQWIGYDDVESLQEKLNFLLQNGLGGAMIWSIDTDDFGGYCSPGQKYPLLRSVMKKLNNIDGPDPIIHRPDHGTTSQPDSQTTKSPNPPPITTRSPPTSPPDGKFQCHQAGFFADPQDRRKYHQCVDFGGYLKDFEFMCGQGTHYDQSLHVCVRD